MAEAIRDRLIHSKAERMSRKAAKEATTVRDPGLVNPRVWMMLKEAMEFKTSTIAPFQSQLADLEIATFDFMEGLLPLLHAPLPRVWDMVEGGLAEPIRATVSHNHPSIAGGDMAGGAIRASLSDFEARLQLQVRRPLAQWVDALDAVRDHIPELDRRRSRLEKYAHKMKRAEKRVERDTRHRLGVKRGARGISVRGKAHEPGVKGMLYRCTHPRADEELEFGRSGRPGMEAESARAPASPAEAGERGSTVAGSHLDTDFPPADLDDDRVVAREFKREDRAMKLTDTQRKLEAAQEGFLTEESLLSEQLSGLCRDASWTKSYMAAALLMTKELFQETVFNLGETMQPLPVYKSLAAAGRGAGAPAGELESTMIGEVQVPLPVPGRMGSNMAYCAAMPEFASRARARATLDDLKLAASRRLHATMATAQPLELHATPESRAGDLVPPSRRGLSDRPLTAVRRELAATPSMSVTGHMSHPLGGPGTPVTSSRAVSPHRGQALVG